MYATLLAQVLGAGSSGQNMGLQLRYLFSYYLPAVYQVNAKYFNILIQEHPLSVALSVLDNTSSYMSGTSKSQGFNT